MSKAVQSNTQVGDIRLVAGVELSGLEGRLVKVANASGKAVGALPVADTDLTPYVLVEGGASGANVSVRPLEPGRNVRLVLLGECAPGDVLVLADTSVEADRGKVRALPADAGTYRGLAVAEETGVEGQWVLARPAAVGAIVVTE